MNRHSLIILFAIILTSCGKEQHWKMTSPNGQIEVSVTNQPGEGKLVYEVFLHEGDNFRTILEPSQLGLEREDATFRALDFISMESSVNLSEKYTLLTGKKRNQETVYNESVLSFKNKNGELIDIIFRLYDEGVAFSYYFPSKSEKLHRLKKEYTSFNLGEGLAWMQPYDTIADWAPAYETYYLSELAVGTSAPVSKNGWAFPLLFHTDNLWIFISEAGFDGSYGGSHLESECPSGEYFLKYAEPGECRGYYEDAQIHSLPWKTPWRFIVAGKDPATIVESDLVTHLAEDVKVKDLSWIKPGRASWSWWSTPDSPQDYNLLVPFVDLAADMGWEYSLVDANWNKMINGDLKKIVKYAQSKGVGILLWYNSGGKHNVVKEAPRDLMDERRIRRREFARISEMGVKGIKVDFFQSDKQVIIKQYIEILEDAADYQLLVNFHGCTLPKGWRRTYPHLMTMEAVRGGESYIFDRNFPKQSPAHISTIPFLRNVVGSVDYTPGGFSNNHYAHLTTYGFELALPVIIESGICHFVEKPDRVYQLPGFAVEILREMPVVWDETRFLSGYPGKDVVIARRSGENWYIGGINSETTAKKIKPALEKIGIRGKSVEIIHDGTSPNELVYEIIGQEKAIPEINMPGLGGFLLVVRQ